MIYSSINVTLNTYTHVNYEDAVAECKRLRITKRYRTEQTMKLEEKIEELLQAHQNTKYNEFWAVCKKIVEDSIQHSKLITSQMRNYDLHDASHSEQVIVIVESLLSDKINEITCYEAILLYLSAYLHDSAMALPDWEYELLKAVEGTEDLFDNTLAFRISNDFKKEHSYSEALKIISDNKDYSICEVFF